MEEKENDLSCVIFQVHPRAVVFGKDRSRSTELISILDKFQLWEKYVNEIRCSCEH